MYQIDKTSNSITALSATGFGALGFNERAHLQEWIAKCPECLGEELLILAKEFDGFDETKERLDLLALDKQGCLVLIETPQKAAGIRCRKEFDGLDPDNWPEMIEWLTEHVKRLEKAFGNRLKPLGQKLKAEFNSTGAFQGEVEG